MPTSTLIAPPHASAESAVGRCLELRPTLAQLGLPSVVLGIGRTVLGSGPAADITLPVEGVAEQHCEILFNGREAQLRVISPLTWLNDGPVREARLRTGDVVTLGPVELEAAYVDVPLPPPPPQTDETPRVKTRPPERASGTASPPRSRKSRREQTPTGRRTARTDRDVQPLLDDAEAGRRLRRDLERLEREAAWHRRQAAATFTPPAPAAPHNDAVDQLQRRLTERELDLSRREQVQSQAEQRVAERVHELQERQQSLEQDRRTLAAERSAVAEQLRAVQHERESLQTAAVARQQAAATEQSRRVELEREQTRLAGWSRQLQTQQRELETRQAALELRQGEFDSAVEALDADRALVQRERETLKSEAQRTLREAEQLRARIVSAETALRDREAHVLDHSRQLAEQLAELESRQQLETERRQGTAEETAARQLALEQRETAAQARERSLVARELELRQQAEQAADEAVQRRLEREELDAARAALDRTRHEVTRLRTELTGDQERLRGQRQTLQAQADQLAQDQQYLQVQRSQLEQSSRAVEQQGGDLGRRESELRHAQRELESRQQALVRRQAALEAESRQVAERAAEVDARRADADASTRELQAALEQDRVRLAAARGDVVQLEQRLLAEAERLRAREAGLGVSAQAVASGDAAAQLELAAREQRLAAAEADLQRRTAELTLEQARLLAAEQAPDGAPADWEHDRSELQNLHDTAATTAEAAATALRNALDDVTTERDRLRDEVDALYRAARTAESAPSHRNDSAAVELSQRQRELESGEQELQAAARQLQEQWTEFDSAAAQMEVERRELQELREALEAERAVVAQTALTSSAAHYDARRAADVSPALPSETLYAAVDAAGRESASDTDGATPTAAEPLWRRPSDGSECSPAPDAGDSGEPHTTDAGPEPTWTTPASAGESSGIRSQLAALFGIDPTDLEAKAAQQDEPSEDVAQPPTAIAPRAAAPSVAAAPVETKVPAPRRDEPLPGVDADSIAAYMQRLLPQTPTSPAPVAEEPRGVETPAAATPVAAEAQNSDRSAASRTGRRGEEPDVAGQRAQMDSMRQIANLSARAAVATHYSRKLQLTHQVMLTLTVVGAVLSLGLFGMGFITKNSYEVQALGAAVITLITGLELARTTLRIRQVRKIVESAAALGDAAASASEAAK